MKEYNVDGLTDKLTTNLEDHYQDKLLSIANGSFDSHYRQRLMGKGKDGQVSNLQVKKRETTYFNLSSILQLFSKLQVHHKIKRENGLIVT